MFVAPTLFAAFQVENGCIWWNYWRFFRFLIEIYIGEVICKRDGHRAEREGKLAPGHRSAVISRSTSVTIKAFTVLTARVRGRSASVVFHAV